MFKATVCRTHTTSIYRKSAVHRWLTTEQRNRFIPFISRLLKEEIESRSCCEELREIDAEV